MRTCGKVLYLEYVGKRRNRLIQELISSLSTSFIFGALWAVSGSGIWLFVGLFAGVFPALGSAGKLLAELSDQRRLAKEAPKMARARQEKELLRVAKMENGSITPAVAALRTSCSVDEADEILQTLASKGYATMEVDDNGRIYYSFPEFSTQQPASDHQSSSNEPADSNEPAESSEQGSENIRSGNFGGGGGYANHG